MTELERRFGERLDWGNRQDPYGYTEKWYYKVKYEKVRHPKAWTLMVVYELSGNGELPYFRQNTKAFKQKTYGLGVCLEERYLWNQSGIASYLRKLKMKL